MGRVRAVKHQAAQVRDGDKVEERKRGKKELRSTHWESPWRHRELQMYYGLFQQQGLAVWSGLFSRDVLQRHSEAAEIIHESARLYLCNYLDMTRAEEISCGVILSANMHSPSLELCL